MTDPKDIVHVDISRLSPPPPAYSEGWSKGFERGQTLGLRRVRRKHAAHVWQNLQWFVLFVWCTQAVYQYGPTGEALRRLVRDRGE